MMKVRLEDSNPLSLRACRIAWESGLEVRRELHAEGDDNWFEMRGQVLKFRD
jgi:hypothetical protein